MHTRLTWNAPEYIHTPKSAEWYLAFGIITLALILTGALMGNYLFVGVIALATLALLFYSNRVPRTLTATLEREGMWWGETEYPYRALAAFGIENGARLLLKQKSFLAPFVVIPLSTIHPNLIRAALAEVLPEEDLREPFAQKLLEYIGF